MPNAGFDLVRKSQIISLIAALYVVVSQFSPALSITPLEQAQNDYTYQITKYQETKDAYQTASSNFKTYKTATAKNEAFAKTKTYLVQVKNVYFSYINLVKERTNSVNWDHSAYKKDDVTTPLNTQIEELAKEEKKVRDAQTLEDLTPVFKELTSVIEAKIVPQVFRALATSDIAQVEDLSWQLDQNSQKVDDYIKDRYSQHDTQLYLNWKTEVGATKSKIATNIEKYKTTLANSNVYTDNVAIGTNFKFDTSEARQTLKSTKQLIRELIK